MPHQPTPPSVLREFGPRTMLTDEVPAYMAPRGTTWHTQWACPSLRRTRASALLWEGAAAEAELYLGDPSGRYRRTPCLQCAIDDVTDLAIRGATTPVAPEPPGPLAAVRARTSPGRGVAGPAHDAGTVRIVLGCALDARDIPDRHSRCPHCARLRALAARHALPAHTSAAGYQLVAATIRHQAAVTLQRVYALHTVPEQVPPVTADLLRAAWSLRPARTGGPVRHRRGQRWLTPTDELAWTQADLVTAAPTSRDLKIA